MEPDEITTPLRATVGVVSVRGRSVGRLPRAGGESDPATAPTFAAQ